MFAGQGLRVAWISAITMSGCASLSEHVYVTQSVAIDSDPTVVFAAVAEFAEEQGWSVERAAPGAGFLEAVSAERDLGELVTRDRWTFHVTSRELTVTKELEAHFGPERGWSASPYVCETYTYSEEAATLSAIAERLNAAQPSLLTASRMN